VSRKAQKKQKLREEAISKAQAILGVSSEGVQNETKSQVEVKEERGGYESTEKKNERFEAFYKTQNLIPEDEFEDFMETFRKPLPVTFRITGYKGEAQELLKMIKGKFFKEAFSAEVNGEIVSPPAALPWYPGELAWQLNVAKSDIRHCEGLKKLHKFMIAEQEGGHITRQEAVSMIPPLLLDVQPHHRVMDMCAAPGSKTAQIIEQLHGATGFGIPKGFVVANDADNKRCYLLVHQAKRLQSPSGLIMNADAAFLPNMRRKAEKFGGNMNYDRVLCDVPCSGDGTLRKNIDVWKKWSPQNGNNLHGLQRRILWRGLEVLEEGGRLVYSTCSMNPVEDEAVVATALRCGQGSVELVDIEGELPGLKYSKGVTDWKIFSRGFDIYCEHSEVPLEFCKSINNSMFPPSEDEKKWMNLDRCMRLLPHQQNTGGFFVAVLRKVSLIPRLHSDTKTETHQDEQSNPDSDCVLSNGDGPSREATASPSKDVAANNNGLADAVDDHDKVPARSYSPPPEMKIKNKAFTEDPFVFLTNEKDSELIENIRSFYGLNKDFPFEQLFCRSESGPCRSLYLVTKAAKEAVQFNMHRVKFINMGVRVFERQDNKDPTCPCKFRLTQEGAPMILPYLTKRKIPVFEEDIRLLLTRDEQSVPHLELAPSTQEAAKLECNVAGSVAFLYTPRPEDEKSVQCELVLAGWLGNATVRIYIHRNERIHFLQLLGFDWENVISITPNRKERVKMGKAVKRKEMRRKRREEKEKDDKQPTESEEEEGKDLELKALEVKVEEKEGKEEEQQETVTD